MAALPGPPTAVNALKAARQRAGLSQADLARRLGIGQSRISAIENTPLPNLRFGTIDAYLHALGHTPSIEHILGEILDTPTPDTHHPS